MEVVSNLLQAAVTLLGFGLGGIRYLKSRKQEYFLLTLLLWLFLPWLSLLDTVSAFIFRNAAGLLCVRVRLGGQPYLPAHFAGHSGGSR